MKKRKANQYPFIFLTIIHVGMLIYTFYKGKDRKKLVILLLSNIGKAYLFEYIAFNIFQSYIYKPKFFKIKALDNTVGAILSQAVFVPITALFITCFKLGLKTKLFFTMYFVIIERVFIKLGVFSTKWWKTSYTATLLPFYFLLSDFWEKHLQKKTPTVLFLSLLNSLIVINSTILYSLAIFRKLRFGIGYNHSWREHFIVVPLYTIVLAKVTTWAVYKNNYFNKYIVFILRLLFDWLLKKSKILKSKLPYLIEVLIHILMLFVAQVLKRLVYSAEKRKQ